MKLNPDKGKSPEQLAWQNGYAQGFANAKAMLRAADKGWAKPGEVLPMSLDEQRELEKFKATAKSTPAPSQQAAGQEQDERAAFEAALFNLYEFAPYRPTFQRFRDGDYEDSRTHKFWRVWQARAALAQRREPLTDEQLSALLKEARKIIRASSSRSLAKDWDRRATQALAGATTGSA